MSITIGDEHGDPRLDQFTVVTAEYHAGALTGVIGVIGPTRMPYDKVIVARAAHVPLAERFTLNGEARFARAPRFPI